MADEKDLNKEEKETSSDSDQSEEETSEDSSEEGEDKVTLSKSELEQLKEERENYKKGMLSKKQELNELKNQEDVEEELPDNRKPEDLEEPVTKKEFYRGNEKKAIRKFFDQYPDAEKNYDKVMNHFVSKRGKETVEDVAKDLEDAYTLARKWEDIGGEDSEDKESSSELSAEKSKPAGGSGDKGKATKKSGGVLSSTSGPEDWYSSED